MMPHPLVQVSGQGKCKKRRIRTDTHRTFPPTPLNDFIISVWLQKPTFPGHPPRPGPRRHSTQLRRLGRRRHKTGRAQSSSRIAATKKKFRSQAKISLLSGDTLVSMRRMEPSSSLGDKLACLRLTAQAPWEKCAWIPDPIHALIMAALARIFGRLEQLLLLWQSGQFPPPQSANPRRAAAPRPAAAPCRRVEPRARLPRHSAARRDRAAICRRVPSLRASHSALNPPSPPARAPSARPRPTHDPPSICPSIGRKTPPAGVGELRLYTFSI